jgi:hypothetical protein
MFEFKITGTLHEPKSEPVYIPKLLLVPLHPFRSPKDLAPDQPPEPTWTNAPPVP